MEALEDDFAFEELEAVADRATAATAPSSPSTRSMSSSRSWQSRQSPGRRTKRQYGAGAAATKIGGKRRMQFGAGGSSGSGSSGSRGALRGGFDEAIGIGDAAGRDRDEEADENGGDENDSDDDSATAEAAGGPQQEQQQQSVDMEDDFFLPPPAATAARQASATSSIGASAGGGSPLRRGRRAGRRPRTLLLSGAAAIQEGERKREAQMALQAKLEEERRKKEAMKFSLQELEASDEEGEKDEGMEQGEAAARSRTPTTSNTKKVDGTRSRGASASVGSESDRGEMPPQKSRGDTSRRKRRHKQPKTVRAKPPTQNNGTPASVEDFGTPASLSNGGTPTVRFSSREEASGNVNQTNEKGMDHAAAVGEYFASLKGDAAGTPSSPRKPPSNDDNDNPLNSPDSTKSSNSSSPLPKKRPRLASKPSAHPLQAERWSQESSQRSHASSIAASSTKDDPPLKVTLGMRSRTTYGRNSNHDDELTPQTAAMHRGNYRLLVDDLSYLCTALLDCRRRQPPPPPGGGRGMPTTQPQQQPQPQGWRHTALTAGAACDIAALVGQAETRTALIMSLGGQRPQQPAQQPQRSGARNVGALGAVLEAIACAPPAMEWTEVCRGVIDGERSREEWREGNGALDEEGTGVKVAIPTFRTKRARQREAQDGNQSNNAGQRRHGQSKHDVVAAKALSITSLFVGIDCTGSGPRAALNPKSKVERAAVKAARKGVLQHTGALRGIARLAAADPVVHAYLSPRCDIAADEDANDDDTAASSANLCGDEGSLAGSSVSSLTAHQSQFSLDGSESQPGQSQDPTRRGRRMGRRKKASLALHPSRDAHRETDEAASSTMSFSSRQGGPQSPQRQGWMNGSGKSHSLEFHSESKGSAVSPTGPKKLEPFEKPERGSAGDKYRIKMAKALSRMELHKETTFDVPASDGKGSADGSTCRFCTDWEKTLVSTNPDPEISAAVTAASLALDAADCIISGKDKSFLGEEGDDAEMGASDSDSDDDFLGNINAPGSEQDLLAKNPILYTNEMLRRSGSLPDYARSYAATLSAMLLACNEPTHCPKCLGYLQTRSASLSGIADNLCLLSPMVSMALSSPDLLLVPSLLRAIAEFSFGDAGNPSSLGQEVILSSLKTLTGLTHENSIACEQLVQAHGWDIALPTSSSSDQITGVGIIFSHLLKMASGSAKSNNGKAVHDMSIYCLSILSNIVEMAPALTKPLFERMSVSGEQISALTWLTRWIVSTTSGFRRSIMKGSFGSQSEEGTKQPSAEDEEEGLPEGEEGNLVIAGNGIVLLAYLMLDDDAAPSSHTTNGSIRDAIIKELPVDASGTSGGTRFMINTLKAFCNFSHFSMGDLSLAVIAPVMKLIAGLEKIDVAEQRKSWL